MQTGTALSGQRIGKAPDFFKIIAAKILNANRQFSETPTGPLRINSKEKKKDYFMRAFSF